jgi:hypothetical protein
MGFNSTGLYNAIKAIFSSYPETGDAAADGLRDAIVDNFDSDSGWIDLTLAGTWVWYGTGWAQPQYKKIGNRVYVRGLIKDGAATTLFTFPEDARPAATQGFPTYAGATIGLISVPSTGIVTINSLRSYVYLDSISFEVAP